MDDPRALGRRRGRCRRAPLRADAARRPLQPCLRVEVRAGDLTRARLDGCAVPCASACAYEVELGRRTPSATIADGSCVDTRIAYVHSRLRRSSAPESRTAAWRLIRRHGRRRLQLYVRPREAPANVGLSPGKCRAHSMVVDGRGRKQTRRALAWPYQSSLKSELSQRRREWLQYGQQHQENGDALSLPLAERGRRDRRPFAPRFRAPIATRGWGTEILSPTTACDSTPADVRCSGGSFGGGCAAVWLRPAAGVACQRQLAASAGSADRRDRDDAAVAVRRPHRLRARAP